jgi:hypothetical protein
VTDVQPPQGRTVTEWAVQYAPHGPLTERPPYMFEVTAPWTEETAKAEADRLPDVVVYARQRTVYADHVTDWSVSPAPMSASNSDRDDDGDADDE